jgi:hypothetical protein
VRLKVSDFPGDDLLVIEPERKQLSVLAGDKLLAQPFDGDMKATSTKVPGVITSLVTEKTPAAFLSMRLDADALDDLVMLTGGSAAPATLTTQDSGLLNAQVANAPGVNNYSVLGNGGRPVVLPGNSKANLEANTKTSGKTLPRAPEDSPSFWWLSFRADQLWSGTPGTLTEATASFYQRFFFDSYSFSGHAGEQVAVVLIRKLRRIRFIWDRTMGRLALTMTAMEVLTHVFRRPTDTSRCPPMAHTRSWSVHLPPQPPVITLLALASTRRVVRRQ